MKPLYNNTTICRMNIKYGTLTEYVYYLERYNDILKKRDRNAKARFLADNKHTMDTIRKLQRQILSSGALDPADPLTRTTIGEDLYLPATQNGILFYPHDAEYIHNTIHTDNVYRILPQNPYIAAQSGDYMVKKMIVNYALMSYYVEFVRMKSVWFMITEHYGEYFINIFYDNEYNKANGEDL